MEQLMILQARSARLREALTERGVLQDYSKVDGPALVQPVDWECGLSTPDYPKSCLYSLDAEHFTKVVGPADGNANWIGLSALNRLRRTDPTKVEPLWHSQYSIFGSWFRGSSPYSMYAYLPWQGYLLALLLDVPLVLSAVVVAVIGFVLALTRPIWESMLTLVLTSQFLWKKWPNWGRFVHAALPLKLLLGQMAWKGLTSVFGKIKSYVREYLVEAECRVWEDAIPLTILEGIQKAMELEEDSEEDDIIEALATEDSEDEDENDEGETMDLDDEEETSDEDSEDNED